jgi:aminoglycoside 3-N-acetyltransferase I
MDTPIRRLDAADLTAMRAVNALFADVFEDEAAYQSQPPGDAYLAGFLQSQDHIVLAASRDDVVVGGLVAYVLHKFEMERREVYVYDLAVSTEHQGQGIGRSLIETLQGIGRDLGAYVVFVQADEGDDAVNFYESLGPAENIRARNFDFLL